MFVRNIIKSGTLRQREDLLSVMEAALRSVDPHEAVRKWMELSGDSLRIGSDSFDLKAFERIFVVGAGKAGAPMAKAVEEMLGGRISAGWINVRYGYALPSGRIRIHEAGHPIPDENGVFGTERILRIAEGAGRDDLVIVLISGGGSALLVAPAPGITLSDIRKTNRLLLESGAAIGKMNSVRKHISRVKGGLLAKAAFPATVVSLVLSDVIGNPLDVIASGPTVPDTSTFQDAMDVLTRYDLLDKVPESVLQRLERGVKGLEPETPKPGDRIFSNSSVSIIGDNRIAAEAAVKEAAARRYNSMLLTTFLEGEAKEVGKFLAALAREEISAGGPLPLPACLILGGETTVTIRGDGVGGRNQEVALSAALALDGVRGKVMVASLGTDGTDGPTDAAGGVVDGRTVERGMQAGLSAIESLSRNDSYTFLKAAGGLLITGPTMTNVNDLMFVCVVPV